MMTLEDAGHCELIDLTAPAWGAILAEPERVLDYSTASVSPGSFSRTLLTRAETLRAASMPSP